METAPLKSFAIRARTALIREVAARIAVVLAPASPERIEQPSTVAALEKAIRAAGGGDAGRRAVADKVAYTWFNRIIALRFMDANGYTGIGVVSPERDRTGGQPEVLAEAKRGNIDSAVITNKRTVETLTSLLNGTRRSDDPQGEAYALLLAEYCRYWNHSMPFMFEPEGDYTEFLIPATLLADDSVLARAVAVLTEKICQDVEVIGWLYQFYIAERKADVFAGFKKGKKAGAAEIPAATQLFTPHWIVRYLVENSLGRLWLLNRPASRLVEHMEYYIAPADEETDFLKVTSPEELKIIDPACGSGHMLTYAFDLLYAIYEEEGYAPSDIPGLIVAKNLYGTELDPRAGALAAFALTMKARARQRTFLSKRVQPNICALEPISFTPTELDALVTSDSGRADEEAFWNQFEHADTYGALIRSREDLISRFKRHIDAGASGGDLFAQDIFERASRVIDQATYLSGRYTIVVTNPPYMGSGNMGAGLSVWLKGNYPDWKQDLYAAFVSRATSFAKEDGLVAMIIGDSWMTAKTFEGFRKRLLQSYTFLSLLHLHDSAYHADVFGANTAFVLSKGTHPHRTSLFVQLEPLSAEAKRARLLEAVRNPYSSWAYHVQTEQFDAVPGTPFVYRLSDAMRGAFKKGSPLEGYGFPRQGIKTGNNERFLRFWYEVSQSSIGRNMHDREEAQKSKRKWFPCQKGGEYRRWFGNDHYVLNWLDDGYEIRNFRDDQGKLRSRPQNLDWMFGGGVTWSTVSSGPSSFRISLVGTISESKGAICYAPNRERSSLLLGFLNSTVASALLDAVSPTVDYGEGVVARLPISHNLLSSDVSALVEECTAISEKDWRSQETALDFQSNELIARSHQLILPIERAVARWEERAVETTRKLQGLEIEINRSVAEAYGLLGEVATEVAESDVSLFQNRVFLYGEGRSSVDYARLARDNLAKDLVSYAVGCMFGRYSLDEPGLILANQGDTLENYLAKVAKPSFVPDKDNVIPIVDGDWFEDDIVERFRQFLRVAFGEQHFEENLRFVIESLGVKDQRDYFVKSFYKDHVQRYKQRPIYWLFSSPKGSFNALIYMHRYTPSTTSAVLNEYLREFKAKLEASRQHHERLATGSGTLREKAVAQKEADRLRKVLLELDEYEHDVLYPLATQQVQIDLDDGVKANYPKFGTALKKIAGLEASDE